MRPGIVDLDTGLELWTAEQCAEHCGIRRGTWSSYHARGNIVPKDVGNLGTFSLWDANRPSQRKKEN